jgi:hypothetical protein
MLCQLSFLILALIVADSISVSVGGVKIQTLGLSRLYKDKSTAEGKWLSKFFGLSFLEPQEVEESFVEDIMSDAPENDKCLQFADYVLEGYILATSSYPPVLWSSSPKTCREAHEQWT